MHLARHVRLGSESLGFRATAPPGLTLGAGGRILPAVASASPPASRAYDHLIRAVETHAAIRDGAPHPGESEPAPGRSSQAQGVGSGGSRRAPRTRKKRT